MPACDIVDMHEIEAGVDEPRNAAGCRLDDDPACRRRFGRAAQSAPSDCTMMAGKFSRPIKCFAKANPLGGNPCFAL